jgi:hypothetical protein
MFLPLAARSWTRELRPFWSAPRFESQPDLDWRELSSGNWPVLSAIGKIDYTQAGRRAKFRRRRTAIESAINAFFVSGSRQGVIGII